ncbi:MAG TPA: hypothetical protein VLZ81_14955, partial [Blastocatellia bacterium]|nr:hypothetical protein [Blastocatellia bacterium]
QAAIALLEKGIEHNPEQWRLYQDLGYIYWQMGDFGKAAEVYDEGSKVPGALWWMRDLAGLMRIKGGSREVARGIYSTYLTSDDANIRSHALFRLKLLKAMDEIDAVNALAAKYRGETGRCPSSLRVLAKWLQAAGVDLNDDGDPVDPDGYPFSWDSSSCRAAVSVASDLPRTL